MNFKEIKNLMDADSMEDQDIPNTKNDIKPTQMPINKVKRKIIGEIITQLICILIFFLLPSFVKMHDLPQSIYYLLIGITSLITLGYLRRMIVFVYRKNDLSGSAKQSITNYLFEFRLMLETYKTACISGSLLLPIAMIPVFTGKKSQDPSVFEDFMRFDVSPITLIYYLIGYIAIAIFFEIITRQWIKSIYGSEIENLKKVLDQLND